MSNFILSVHSGTRAKHVHILLLIPPSGEYISFTLNTEATNNTMIRIHLCTCWSKVSNYPKTFLKIKNTTTKKKDHAIMPNLRCACLCDTMLIHIGPNPLTVPSTGNGSYWTCSSGLVTAGGWLGSRWEPLGLILFFC